MKFINRHHKRVCRGAFRIAGAAAVLTLFFLFAGGVPTLKAAPIIDGVVNSADGYDVLFPVTFLIKPKNNSPAGTPNLEVSGGGLYVYRDLSNPGSDIYIAMSVPTQLSDNIYGWSANRNNPQSEWLGRTHNYGDLIGDAALFDFYDADGNAVRLDWTFSYFGDTIPAPSDSFIVDWNTSLNHNLNNFDTAGYNSTLDPSDPYYINDLTATSPKPGTEGWTDNLVYEFQIDGGFFGTGGFGLVFADSHNSPVKLKETYAAAPPYAGYNEKNYQWNTAYGPESGGGTPIVWDYDPTGPYGINSTPEPSVYLMLLSSAMLVWMFNRRKPGRS